ncbi:MAG: hypothetical protein EBS01_04560, partial [Verrucomicrobia bacterium]|nr:hypothetical protein [Verrucomicrobiota bacterium]
MGGGWLESGRFSMGNGVASVKPCASIREVKEAFKILLFVCAVLLLGALLAPPLWWAAHGLMGMGFLPGLQKYAFQKYFNRSVLVAALVLLRP